MADDLKLKVVKFRGAILDIEALWRLQNPAAFVAFSNESRSCFAANPIHQSIPTLT